VAAKFAMDVAIQKAERQGVAAVGVVQLHHIGRVGEYAEMAAARGLVSLIAASGFAEEAARCAPYGGRGRVLDTNPLAMGFPAGSEPPMMFDYATTAVSGVKVALARDRCESLPPGCVIDKDGNPTTDPHDFFAGGAYLPFGGHKGYAIMMAVEFLGRILTGSDAFVDPDWQSTWRRRAEQGVTSPEDLDWVTGVVWDEEGHQAVGRAGFHAAPDANGMLEVGYAIDPVHRRRGFARATLAAMLDRARTTSGVRRVVASVSPDNQASLGLIAQFGFLRTGEQWDEEDGLEWVFEVPVA